MTRSMHRQGIYANLCNDFVVLGWPGRKFDARWVISYPLLKLELR